MSKAKEELSYANKFDHILVNDHLENAIDAAKELVQEFIHS